MLYNLIMVVLVAVMAIFSFFAGAKVFHEGFTLGKEQPNGEKTSKSAPKKPKKSANKPKPNPEIEKMNRILANIEKYDGTSAGQEDIR